MKLNISAENKRFGLTELILFGENSVVFSFFVLYLKQNGYSGGETGLITSLTMIACLIAQPVAGFITEKLIDIKKLIAANIIITTAAIGSIYFFSSSYAVIFACFLAFSLTGRYVPGLMDVYITKVARTKSGLDYGFVRGLGSMGYASVALIMGFVISAFGYASMFIAHTLFCAAALFCLARLPKTPAAPQIAGEKEKRPGLLSSVKSLLKNRGYVLTVASVFIVFIGMNGYGSYLPLYINEIGGSGAHYGICVFVMAMSEIPALWNYKRFSKRFGAEKLLMFALIMSIAKVTLPVLTDNVYLVMILQVLQAVSTGFFIPSVLSYIQKLVCEEEISVAILLASSIYGGGSVIISNLAGGFAIDAFGLSTFFFACSAITALGALCFALALRLGKRLNNLEIKANTK